MDPNKVKRLRDIGYKLQPCCQLCKSGMFSAKSQWGECRKIKYKHQKHSGPQRLLSIHASGLCIRFAKNEELALRMQHYAEFGEWIRV